MFFESQAALVRGIADDPEVDHVYVREQAIRNFNKGVGGGSTEAECVRVAEKNDFLSARRTRDLAGIHCEIPGRVEFPIGKTGVALESGPSYPAEIGRIFQPVRRRRRPCRGKVLDDGAGDSCKHFERQQHDQCCQAAQDNGSRIEFHVFPVFMLVF